MYSDAAYCDRYTPIYNPKLFKMFLQQAKTFIYYDFGWREKSDNLDVVFDYQTYVNKSNGDDPYNIEVEKRNEAHSEKDIVSSNSEIP